MKTRFIVFFIGCFLLFQPVFSQRKVIQSDTYKEVCMVTPKQITPEINTVYYWYKSNEIHQSRGDYNGELLDGAYSKSYYTNELFEKGFFEKGVKKGEWKSWHPNGKIKNVSYWQDGKLNGRFYHLDATGKIIQKGKYSDGLKKGVWLENGTDTLRYKKGKVVVKKTKKRKAKKEKSLPENGLKKKPWYKLSLFSKNKKIDQAQGQSNPESINQINVAPDKKPSFWKRFFIKKPKKEDVTS